MVYFFLDFFFSMILRREIASRTGNEIESFPMMGDLFLPLGREIPLMINFADKKDLNGHRSDVSKIASPFPPKADLAGSIDFARLLIIFVETIFEATCFQLSSPKVVWKTVSFPKLAENVSAFFHHDLNTGNCE